MYLFLQVRREEVEGDEGAVNQILDPIHTFTSDHCDSIHANSVPPRWAVVFPKPGAVLINI